MTKKAKQVFINELIGNVKKDILEKLDKLPEDWDGIELRWLVKEHFELVVFDGWDDKRTRRYKDYYNEVICNNLA